MRRRARGGAGSPVAERVAEMERKRVVFLKERLGEVDAYVGRRATAAAIARLERASRTPRMNSALRNVRVDVFRLMLKGDTVIERMI